MKKKKRGKPRIKSAGGPNFSGEAEGEGNKARICAGGGWVNDSWKAEVHGPIHDESWKKGPQQELQDRNGLGRKRT